MKINWFSPLPPALTDIAQYTRRLLPALAAQAEVTLWTEQDGWEPELERYARVERWRDGDWPALNAAAVTFYHIGNNSRFHAGIWAVSRRCSGIVILHDFRLQDFFLITYRDHQGDESGYAGAMERYYGRDGRQAAQALLKGKVSMADVAERYPLTSHALEGAGGVIVHNRLAFTELTHANRWPVACLPLPYPAAGQPPAPAAPRSLPYRLIVFGYLGKNRRLEPLLRALAELPERRRFWLDIYGKMDDPTVVENLIRALRLQDQVQIHGFVAEPVLEQALSTADLAINLRYPTMGEASGSQLRIWDHALPSLVTNVGWYATLPADTVAFVQPEREIADLQDHLRAFLADPAAYARLGQAGRRVLEERHAPAAYVQGLLEFVPHVQRFRSTLLLEPLLERVVAEMKGCWGSTRLQPAVQRVAEEIYGLTVAGPDCVTS